MVSVVSAASLLIVVSALHLQGQRRGNIYRGYEEAAEWIAQDSQAGASVAAAEIGVVGWLSDRPIVDYLGLLSETSVEEVARGDMATWLAREQPDYYLVHTPVWDVEKPSRAVRWFKWAYRRVYETRADGENNLTIYRMERTMSEAVEAQRNGQPVLQGE